MTPIDRRLTYIFRGSLLRLRIRWAEARFLTISVGCHVDRTDENGRLKWDGSRCLRNTSHGPEKMAAGTINRILDLLEQRIGKAFYRYEMEDRVPDKEELRADLEAMEAESGKAGKRKGFFEAYDEFIADGVRNRFWADGTLRKLKSRKNLLLAFDPQLTFKGLSKERLNDFVNYQTRHSIAGYGPGAYVNTTIKKNINLLKWFLRWAVEKGYDVNQDFKKFVPTLKTPPKDVTFLEWDELMKMYRHDFSDNRAKEAVRDCFCFCCFTSLRYSDLYNLKKSDIRGDEIRITTIKTSDTITIDLNDYSREILEKYRGMAGEKALPVITNQKMNKALKGIAKECGITRRVSRIAFRGGERIETTVPKYELVTTHCGRRTFICNALMLGIPPHVVMKWTGHSDYKAMEPYIAVADRMRKDSMKLFNREEKRPRGRKKRN